MVDGRGNSSVVPIAVKSVVMSRHGRKAKCGAWFIRGPESKKGRATTLFQSTKAFIATLLIESLRWLPNYKLFMFSSLAIFAFFTPQSVPTRF